MFYQSNNKLVTKTLTLIHSRTQREWQSAQALAGRTGRRSIVDTRQVSICAMRATHRAIAFSIRLENSAHAFRPAGYYDYNDARLSFRMSYSTFGTVYRVFGTVFSGFAIQTSEILDIRDVYRIYETWIRGRDTYSYLPIRINGRLFTMTRYNDGVGIVISLFASLRAGL